MKTATHLFGQSYQFNDLKVILAKAGDARSGDVLAGVAAQNSQERVAAKHVLSEITVGDIRENPVIPYEEDCVTRIIKTTLMKQPINMSKIGPLASYVNIFCQTIPRLLILILSVKVSHQKWWQQLPKFAPMLT